MPEKTIVGIVGALLFVIAGWLLFPGIIESALTGVSGQDI